MIRLSDSFASLRGVNYLSSAVPVIEELIADWNCILYILMSEQCGIAAEKGNQLLGMIKINVTYHDNFGDKNSPL